MPATEPLRRDAYHLVVVDDDESLNRSLVLHLEERGYQVSSFLSGREVLESLTEAPSLVLLDVRLKDLDGIEVLRRLREMHPKSAVVMITAFHETEVTVEAARLGAFDYLPKPLSLDDVDRVIERALHRETEARSARASSPPEAEAPASESPGSEASRLIGKSPAMLEVFKAIGAVAPSEASVLLLGESGTGKELVARTIHAHSRRPGPFMSVNCAMLSPEFLVSELFGHEKGAFTGALFRRQGVFELAQHGTLLLDEVSEMDLPLQAKLLRVLQEREFQRLGSNEVIRTDVRVIAATNRDLEELTARGAFREDLYFRLAVVPIRLPPLRDRRDDIPLLVRHILRATDSTPDRSRHQISPEALDVLVNHHWRGNVRELENVLVRASIRAQGASILVSDLAMPGGAEGDSAGVQVERTLEEVERDHIAAVLRHTQGNKAHACRILGISRPTLDSKLKRHHLKVNRRLAEG